MLLRSLYTGAIRCYGLLIRAASLFNPKAKDWISGRANWEAKLRADLQLVKNDTIWIHCASLGEFEQGAPIIEEFKKQGVQCHFLVTFFSPSGFKHAQKPDNATFSYLPLDTKKNAQSFLDLVKPKLVLFIKYEFWVNFIEETVKQRIPLVLAAAIFRKDHYMFKPSGGFMLSKLRQFSWIFTQDLASADVLAQHKINQASVSGDTRFDRVAQLLNEEKEIIPKEFIQGRKLLIIGSSWPEDEKFLANQDWSHWKIVVAPHEINEQRFRQIESAFNRNTVRLSQFKAESVDADLLIIDSIGILKYAYRQATLAWIGGSFGKGLHNTLEAAVYGIPVWFGPNYKKFKEAVELIKIGAAQSFSSAHDLGMAVSKINLEPEILNEMGEKAQKLAQENIGASQKTVQLIKAEGWI